MITWPAGLQKLPVSTTISPVSDTADVAVKSADRKEARAVPASANGSMSKTVPSKMSKRKPAAVKRAGPHCRMESRCFTSGSIDLLGVQGNC